MKRASLYRSLETADHLIALCWADIRKNYVRVRPRNVAHREKIIIDLNHDLGHISHTSVANRP